MAGVPETIDRRIEAVRRFNRAYTQTFGILEDGWQHSAYTLTEGRVLYELARRERPTAAEIGRDLAIDAGYLSRILATFAKQGLVVKRASRTDARQTLLALTAKGRRTFSPLDIRSSEAVGALLRGLTPVEQVRLVGAMDAIDTLLHRERSRARTIILRDPEPGDMGWVISRHGAIYADEYGWNERLEGFIAGIVAGFVENFDQSRERCWIAEVDGSKAGCIVLASRSKTVASLRLFLVEPSARGLGIGKKLVNACVAFAREAGYRRITLWTNDVLTAARHIYQSVGFTLTGEERHHSYGHDLVGQTWDLKL